MNARLFYITAASAAIVFAAAAYAQQNEDNRNRQQERDRQQQQDRWGDQQGQRQMDLQRCSQLLRASVQTRDGEQAGRIQNFAVESENGNIIYAIVNIEGRAQNQNQQNQQNQQQTNRGQNLKAVPFQALNFRDGQNARLNIDSNRWQDAPSFDPSGWNTIGDQEWGRIVHRHYNVNQTETRRNAQILRATDLMECEVRNRERQNLGTTDDLMIDVNRGYVVYALISPAQGVQVDSNFIAVPWQALETRAGQQVVVLDIDRNRLRNAPTVNRVNELTDRQFMQQVAQFYRVEGGPVFGYTPPQGGRGGSGGWEYRSEYGRLFDPNAIEIVRGEVQSIDRFTPMQGMSEGVRLRLNTDDNRTIAVHLGPAWFIERQELRIREGDQVQVIGSRVQVEGRTAIIAAELRHQNQVMLLRDRNGLPRWDAIFRPGDLPRDSTWDRGDRDNQWFPPGRARGLEDRENFPPGRGRDRDN